MFLFLILCALSKISLIVSVGENCVTPKYENGTCIPIKSCPPLLEILINTEMRYTSELAELQKYTCGFVKKTAYVCCPKKGRSITSTITTIPKLKSNLPKNCGRTANKKPFPRIIGGFNIEKGQFPWMVALGYENSSLNEILWSCGGTIITKRHVLTAARCVFNKPLLKYIRIGMVDIKKDWDYWEGEILDSFVHENYQIGSYKNDIAILKIDFDMENLEPNVGPICLSTLSEWKDETFIRYYPFVAGWDVTQLGSKKSSDILQGLQIPILSNSLCELKFNGSVNFDKTLLCAGYQKRLKDACSEDSGGPLLLPKLELGNKETIFYQIGIVSYGFNCIDPKHPGIYTRVSEYLDWIESKLNLNTF